MRIGQNFESGEIVPKSALNIMFESVLSYLFGPYLPHWCYVHGCPTLIQNWIFSHFGCSFSEAPNRLKIKRSSIHENIKNAKTYFFPSHQCLVESVFLTKQYNNDFCEKKSWSFWENGTFRQKAIQIGANNRASTIVASFSNSWDSSETVLLNMPSLELLTKKRWLEQQCGCLG